VSLTELVQGLEEVQAAQLRAAHAEAQRGDALHLVVAQALDWCRADATQSRHPAHLNRVQVLEDAARRWTRKERADGRT
jgi:hypothetical protein